MLIVCCMARCLADCAIHCMARLGEGSFCHIPYFCLKTNQAIQWSNQMIGCRVTCLWQTFADVQHLFQDITAAHNNGCPLFQNCAAPQR